MLLVYLTYILLHIIGLIYGCAIGSSIGLCCNQMSSDECTFHYGANGLELSPNNQSGRPHDLRPHSDWSTDFEQVVCRLFIY